MFIAFVQVFFAGASVLAKPFGYISKRIDDRIAGNGDLAAADPFFYQNIAIICGRCKVKIRDLTDQTAVHFLRKRAETVARTQPGFDMADLYPAIKSRDRSGQRSCGVALHQDNMAGLKQNISLATTRERASLALAGLRLQVMVNRYVNTSEAVKRVCWLGPQPLTDPSSVAHE